VIINKKIYPKIRIWINDWNLVYNTYRLVYRMYNIMFLVSLCYCSRHEVLVNGHKQGATKKAVDGKATGSSALCKKSLIDACRHMLANDGNTTGRDITYAQIKLRATSYRDRWVAVRRQLGFWTVKPDGLYDFTWRVIITNNFFGTIKFLWFELLGC